MDNTFIQIVSLVVSLSNQVADLQRENASLRAQVQQQLAPSSPPTPLDTTPARPANEACEQGTPAVKS